MSKGTLTHNKNINIGAKSIYNVGRLKLNEIHFTLNSVLASLKPTEFQLKVYGVCIVQGAALCHLLKSRPHLVFIHAETCDESYPLSVHMQIKSNSISVVRARVSLIPAHFIGGARPVE